MMASRVIGVAAAIVGVLAIAMSGGACSEEGKTRVRGQLMVAIQTDVPLPQEVDDVRVEVLADNQIVFGNDYVVGAGFQTIPATIALVSDDTLRPVTIRVIGKRKNVVKTLRETITTIPRDRVATLRMPIQWLCDGAEVSKCAPDQTCNAGTCVPKQQQANALPTYDSKEVFGGGDEKGNAGTCFDTVPCMVQGALTIPTSECTVPTPAAGVNVNVALRVPEGGICDSTGTNCFVPLDRDDKGADGWQELNGNIKLPKEVCTRLDSGRIRGVVVSTTCPSKDATQPTCGSWSSVQAPRTNADAGAAAAPVLVSNLPQALGGGQRAVCCPLFANAGKLTTCVCSASEMQLVAVDGSSGATNVFGSVIFQSQPTVSIVPAALSSDGVLYFFDNKKIRKLAGGQAADVGSITDGVDAGTALLVDGDSLYLLVIAQGGDAGAGAGEFKILKMNRQTGASSSFGTGSNKAVLQFAQDADSLYIGSNVDVGAAPAIQRTSKLLKMAKATGATSVLAESRATVPENSRGGFFGIRVANGAAFAVEEGDVSAQDKSYASSFVRIPLAGGSSERTTLLQQRLNAERADNRTLGVVKESLFGFQRQLSSGVVSNASLSVVPTTSGASRIVADLVADSPVETGGGIVFDEATSTVFFLTRGGRLFKMAL